jgi:microcystin-dependent protein
MAVPNIFYPVTTEVGRAAAVSLSDFGLSLRLTHVSFGTGQYNPTGTETALFNQVKFVPITGAMKPRPNHLRLAGVWSELSEFSEIGEIGFWAGEPGTPGAVLFALYSRAVGGPIAQKSVGVEFVAFYELVFNDVPAGSIVVEINPLLSEALSLMVTHEADDGAHPQYLLRRDFVNGHSLMAAAAVGGTANAVLITLHPETEITAYAYGQVITFVATASNTGPVTVNVNGRGLRNVTKAGATPLTGGDLASGSVYTLFYDGAQFQISGGIGGSSTFSVQRFTATAGQTDFPITYTVGALLVYQNGRLLADDDFTATDGAIVVLSTGATEDDEVVGIAFRAFNMLDHYTKAESDARYLLASSATAYSPPGMVSYFARDTAPAGWIKANGALISRTTYAALFAAIGVRFGAGDGSTTFRLPDLRGEFIRGHDDGRGIDTGRIMGSFQADELRAHSHTYDKINLITNGEFDDNTTAGNNYTSTATGSTGGGETRPRNISLLACIRF